MNSSLQTKIRVGTQIRSVALIAISLLATAALAAPAHVLIRVPPGQKTPASLPALLAHWRQAGQVAKVLLLTDGRAEKAGTAPKFVTLAVLDFADEPSCESWQKTAAAELPSGLLVRRADLVVEDATPAPHPTRAFFLVNTYTPTVPTERYDDFVTGYIQPLYEAMLATQHLVSYGVYVERGETGKVDALSVLEYRDAAAFAAMPPLKKGIRAKLTATAPSYAKYDKIKDGLRLDVGGTFATHTELPAVTAP